MKNNITEIVFSNYHIDATTNQIIKIDKQFTELTGYTMTEIEAKKLTLFDLLPPEDLEDYTRELRRQFAAYGSQAYIWHRLRCRDGHCIYVFCYGEILPDGTASIRITDTTFVREMADEREIEAEKQNELLKLTFESEQDTLFEYDAARDKLTLSHVVDGELAVVYEENHYKGQSDSNRFIHPEDKRKYVEQIPLTGSQPVTFHTEIRLISDKQRYEWTRCNGVCLYDRYGRLSKVVGKFHDISDEIAAAQKIKEQAERDELTGLYHHADMLRHVTERLQVAKDGLCAMFVIDIDDFKLVNEAFGHKVGDAVLMQVGGALKRYALDRGYAGRIGADEFTVFLWEIKDRTDVQRHMLAISKLVACSHENVPISCSVGASVVGKADCNPMDLYIEADRAAFAAKKKGHGQQVLYDNSLLREEQAEVYIAEEDLSLNDIQGFAYITDVNTYELLFVNEPFMAQMESFIGHRVNYEGKKCYHICQNSHTPCEDCNMNQLRKNENTYRYRKNEFNQKEYVCKDSLINYGGRIARLEVSVEVTDSYHTLQAVTAFFESNSVLRKCIRQIAETSEVQHDYHKILRFVGEFYHGDCCGLIERHDGHTYDLHKWSVESGESFEGDTSDCEKLKSIYTMMKRNANEQGRIHVENLFAYKESDPELYEQLSHDKIWTLMGNILMKNGEEMGLFFVVNPKQHLENRLLFTTISTFMESEINRRLLWDKQQFELTHDPLTGVLNRTSYMNMLAKVSLAQSVGLANVDVNSLTRINNDFGLAKGNQVICEIVDILRQAFEEEQIFRFHSDDFTILVLNEDRDSFSKRVEKARNLFEQHESGACIGYVWDDFDMNIQKMSGHADEILMLEKQKFHESDRDSSMTRQKEILKELQVKIDAGKFAVYLQPKVNMSDGSYYGAEALIRAIDVDGKLIPPARFIPILEKTYTIQVIDLFVFEEVCKMIRRWMDEGTKLVPISFNFSRLTLLSTNLVNRVEEIVQKYNVPKDSLEIEITETIGDLEYDMISRIATDLRNAGYRLSMDDFGTKYSSVSTLSYMKFDMLKIDRSMVNTLEQNEVSRQIMKHVIAMCKDLGIECIAEGVETKEQVMLLTQMDCQIAQGYLYGKPMPMHEFESLYKGSI